MRADDEVLSLTDDQRRDVMKAPDEVSAILRLKALGSGSKRIAAELWCPRNTVRRWLTEGDWRACAFASRSKKLDGRLEPYPRPYCYWTANIRSMGASRKC